MFHDARQLSPGAEIEGDVCIVGSGPAGMAVASELAARGISTLVLESGGRRPDAAVQSLAAGEVRGDRYSPLVETRRRQLGGTTHLWNTRLGTEHGFRAAPLDALDFTAREWLPGSGWPFGLRDLLPYYERAQRFCGLGPLAYEGADWETPEGQPLPLDPAIANTSVWQFSPRETFTVGHVDALERSERVTVWLNASVTRLETAETGGEVTHLLAATPEGKRFRVRAGTVVLATGGIENARLLLLSDTVRPGGLGNAHDLVGRFFMEHQVVSGGILTPRDRAIFDRLALYDERPVRGTTVMGQVRLSEEVMRRERLLNLSFAFYPRHPRHERIRPDAIHSLEALLGGAKRLRVPEGARAHLVRLVSSLDFVGASVVRKLSGGRLFDAFVPGPDLVSGDGWSILAEKPRRFGALEVLLHTEQSPHPDNRVVLSEERDALGCRRAALHWRWREEDRARIGRAQEIFAAEVERAGIGRYRPRVDEAGLPVLRFAGLHHHMGTTRMDPDPRRGVVDENGRVHGVGNLFVTGCSVFPTGGYINCTLTIVALAMRLADHLAARQRAAAPLVATPSPGA